MAYHSFFELQRNERLVFRGMAHLFYEIVDHDIRLAVGAASIGFTAVSVITGTVRELISYGTIFGKSVSHLPVFSGMALPFGGLLVIAFLAALQKWIIQKIKQ